MKIRNAVLIAVLVVGITIDLVLKAVAVATLQMGTSLEVVPGFNFTLGYNPGIAFGMFPAQSNFSKLLLTFVQVGLVAILGLCLVKSGDSLSRLGFALMVSGATANIIDRIMDGVVTDFIDLHWQGWHWPAFNLADAMICVGVAALLFASFQKAGPRDEFSTRETT
jgi:signal peptidase II